MNVLPKKAVIDVSLIIDLYATPNGEHASIAEEVATWITESVAEVLNDN